MTACPHCGSTKDRIIATSHPDPSLTRRRHQCLHCTARWSTIAALEPGSIDLSTVSTNEPQQPPLMGIYPQRVFRSLDHKRSLDKQDLDPEISEREEDPTRARSKKTGQFEALLQAFAARWQRSYKRPYPMSSADRSQLGRFMREQGNYIETWPAICDRYLSDRRQFVMDRSNGHTLKWLVTSGLAMYGGSPRESAEQYAARLRKEHEARKRQGPTKSRELRELIANLANGKELNDGKVDPHSQPRLELHSTGRLQYPGDVGRGQNGGTDQEPRVAATALRRASTE